MQIHSPATHPASKLDQLGDEIAELSAHLDAATARLLDLIRKFDARGGWNTGFRSCAAWLSWRVGLDLGAARERVQVARALGTLPRLAEALARGELSYAKVRALTRVATPETEARLLGVGRAGTAAHVEQIVRGWRCVDRRAEAREAKRRHASRALHVYQAEDGMVVLRGRLEPEVGALLQQALTAARESLYQRARERATFNAGVGEVSEEMPPISQQQADALALLAETALHQGLDPGAPGERSQVVVHVDAPVLADPDRPGQSVLGGAHTFPRKRPSASPATPAGWSCATTRPAACWKSGLGPGRFLRHYAAPSTIGTKAAASQGADSASPRGITCATGRTEARPRSRTLRCSVAGITGRCMRRATRSRAGPTGRSSSGGRTATRCLRCRRLPKCRVIRSRRSERVTTRRACVSPRGRGVLPGSGSV
jgi:hypothetical protein